MFRNFTVNKVFSGTLMKIIGTFQISKSIDIRSAVSQYSEIIPPVGNVTDYMSVVAHKCISLIINVY